MPGARGWIIVSSPPSRYAFCSPLTIRTHDHTSATWHGIGFSAFPVSPGLARTNHLIRVVQFLDDSTPARERLQVTTTSQTQQSRIIPTHVVGEFPRAIAQGSRDNFGQVRKSTSHWLAFLFPNWFHFVLTALGVVRDTTLSLGAVSDARLS